MSDAPAFAAAKALRDTGMAQATVHAPSFGIAAFRAIESVARRQTSVHIDDVLAAGVAPPAHPNAWGAAWARAIRARIIERTLETRPCTSDPKKHAHRYPVYRSRLYRAPEGQR